MMYVRQVVAYTDESRVIGAEGAIPWYLPEDLKRFKRLTKGNTVLMGRKTFESIVKRLGKPLPGRVNVVLTSDARHVKLPALTEKTFEAFAKVVYLTDLKQVNALIQAGSGVLDVIGGETLYRQLLPQTQCVLATEVREALLSVGGDTYYPPLDPVVWTESDREAVAFGDYVSYHRRARGGF